MASRTWCGGVLLISLTLPWALAAPCLAQQRIERYGEVQLVAATDSGGAEAVVAGTVGAAGDQPLLTWRCEDDRLTLSLQLGSTAYGLGDSTVAVKYMGGSSGSVEVWQFRGEDTALAVPSALVGRFTATALTADTVITVQLGSSALWHEKFAVAGLEKALERLPCAAPVFAQAANLRDRNVPDMFVEALLDEPPRHISSPPLEYPPELKKAGIEGRVVLEFVVGLDGRPEPRTIWVIMSSRPEFEVAARRLILGSLYRPGRLRGQAVRTLVRQPIGFSLRRR